MGHGSGRNVSFWFAVSSSLRGGHSDFQRKKNQLVPLFVETEGANESKTSPDALRSYATPLEI